MKKFLMAVAALALMGSVALAGPNHGGTIFAHDANLAYTVDSSNYCGQGVAPSSCEGADTELDGSNAGAVKVWKVYAAFLQGSSPRLKGMAWGIHYDSNNLIISAYGNCCGDPNNGAAEFPGAGWPGSDTGTAMVWQFTQTTQLVESYWFAGYNYAGVSSVFQLRDNPDPVLGGNFADDNVPSQQDPIAGYGSLGFDTPGATNCPVQQQPTGACCINGVCTITEEAQCGGQWMGPNVPCDPNPCVQTGACCIQGVCTVTTQADCQGQYMGDNVPCEPNPCPPLGACCTGSVCTMTLQTECQGDWRGGPCDPNPCPTPVQDSSWGQIKNNYK